MKDRMGYALSDGAFGPAEYPAWTNLYICWAFMGYWKGETEPDGSVDVDAWMTRMVKCLAKVPVDRLIYLGLFGQIPENITGAAIRRMLKALKPYLKRIVAVDIADEPTWDRPTTKAKIAQVRSLMDQVWGERRPVGITYTAAQSMTSDAFGIPLPQGPDFVTLELYSPDGAHPDHGKVANISAITYDIRQAWSKMTPGTRCWYWLCGFNRNGTFTNEDNLAQLQWDTYMLVRDDSRTDGICIFNWNRKNSAISKGSKQMPKVQAAHRRIAANLGIV